MTFTAHNAGRRTFGHFLAFSEDIFLGVKKEGMVSIRRTYDKPNVDTRVATYHKG